MKKQDVLPRKRISIRPWLLAAALALIFVGCGGGGSSDGSPPDTSPTLVFEAPPETTRTVVGIIDTEIASVQQVGPGTTLTLNDTDSIALDPDGRFEIRDVQDGSHSLFLRHVDGPVVEIPFRMLEDRSLSLGMILVRNVSYEHTGFNGYFFGFVDADNDGINDLCVDAVGDGICDEPTLYAGYPYFMAHGFVDADRDGRNDHFRDANGDGLNDLDGRPYGPGFGFVDADGDGICDQTGMPFRHPFGFADENGDGLNDLFRDADGDGINDITGQHYIATPGWIDLDNDGICDFFTDANGDGINDRTGLPYGHGFGWVDADGDGINDRFRDRDGNSINDVDRGPFAGMPYHVGFGRPHIDADGNGLDDVTGMPFRHGFGWVDADGDGVNDAFVDIGGDGVNDITGHHYAGGYMPGPEGTRGGHMGQDDWPMGPGHERGMR